MVWVLGIRLGHKRTATLCITFRNIIINRKRFYIIYHCKNLLLRHLCVSNIIEIERLYFSVSSKTDSPEIYTPKPLGLLHYNMVVVTGNACGFIRCSTCDRRPRSYMLYILLYIIVRARRIRSLFPCTHTHARASAQCILNNYYTYINKHALLLLLLFMLYTRLFYTDVRYTTHDPSSTTGNPG